MASASILRSLCFQAADEGAGPVRGHAFFRSVMWIQEPLPWSLVAQNWVAVLDRGLSSEVGENTSGSVSSNRQNLQVAWCDA